MKGKGVMRQGKNYQTFIVWLLFPTAVCLLAAPLLRHGAAAPARYTFSVVPQFDQRKLYAIWKPIIEEPERRTGLSFELVTTVKIPDFEKEFMKGSFDFVYMNPYHIVKAIGSQDYIPLAADTKPLRGILVVRKESVTRPEDLDGKEVAFPSPNALGASLLMRADLERLYNVKVTPIYVKTHDSVYLHVVKRLVAAGGGVEKTLQEQSPEIRDALRIIYTTRSMPAHPVAAHPRVPKEDREKVRRAFLAMDRTPEGRALLSKVPIQGLRSVSLNDYRPMLGWGLENYWKSCGE